MKAKKYAAPDKNRCVACGACVKVCPVGAISVYRGAWAEVDLEKCLGCGLCAKTCPAGVITLAERSAE